MIYKDVNGTRVVIRQEGPPGIGVPTGGQNGQILRKKGPSDFDVEWANPAAATSGVNGPSSAVPGNIVTFNGSTGNLIQDSGFSLSAFATTVQLSQKVDKVPGFGLSKNDFTDALKTKLDSITVNSFRGNFASLVALQTAVPTGNPGDYAYVLVGGSASTYIWDTVNTQWTPGAVSSESGASIATKLYAEPDTNRFTDYYRIRLDGAVQQAEFDAAVSSFNNSIANSLVRNGVVSSITQASMTSLGFTHQQGVVIGGQNYWIPLKDNVWP